MATIKVKFLGGPTGVRRLKANADAGPTEIGGEMELDERVISRMRGRGYRFEAVENEPLPEPEAQEPPESHRPPTPPRPPGPEIEVARR